MSSNQALDIKNKEFMLIGGLLIILAGLMAFFPSMTDSDTTVDWISLPLVGFPIIVSCILLAFASQETRARKEVIAVPIRLFTLVASLIPLAISTALFFDWLILVDWDLMYNEYALEKEYVWIESIGASWHVGMDGLSFPMVWLTTFLVPITIITTWNEKDGATYHPLLLMMGGALIGVFVALDLFLFYVFWELTLIPMFFLILKWGGKDRRYAAQKFFIYTFCASVIMLLGLITLYFLQPEGSGSQYGTVTGRTFDMTVLFSNATAQHGRQCLLRQRHAKYPVCYADDWILSKITSSTIPHLASRCSRTSTYRWLDAIGWSHAKDGSIWNAKNPYRNLP